jgi:hypothetical protein
MSRFYIAYNQDANSYSVFEAGRKNEFGEPYCHVPLVTREEADLCADSLNNGLSAYAWMEGTGFDPDGIGFDDSLYI